MRDNIYVSTNAFLSRDIGPVLAEAEEAGIYNIELSSGLRHETYDPSVVMKSAGRFRFIVHNYFPPEDTGLVINLASGNDEIREASLTFCKQAIDLSVALGSNIYGVHSGFCYDPAPSDLGREQAHLPRIPMPEANRFFRESLVRLVEYATARGVKLCIENNVVPAFNLIDGVNEIDLMASTDDFQSFMEDVSLSDVRFLLDFGHLIVTAGALGFDAAEFIDLIADRVTQIQLTGNDGVTDQHLGFDRDVWFRSYLPRFSDRIISLEPAHIGAEAVLDSVRIVEEALR